MTRTALILASLLVAASPSFSQPSSMATCVSLVERDRIVERLRSRFQEQLIGNQVSANLHIRELYGSFERNTFTWLVTIPEMDLLCREDSGIGLDRELEALSSNAFTLS